MKGGYVSGFTLFEMMVATAIGATVLLLCAVLLGRVGDGYGWFGGSVSGEREARSVLSQLSADLATARWHEDMDWRRGEGAWRMDRVGFLTLQAPGAQSDLGRVGDVCAVSYFMSDVMVGGQVVRCLMRGVVESGDALAAVRNGAVAGLFGPSDRDEPVASGVVAFEVRPKVRVVGDGYQEWVRAMNSPPDVMEVRLVLARREVTARLVTAQDWDGLTEQGRKVLGDPQQAECNPCLRVYAGLFQFGNAGGG